MIGPPTNSASVNCQPSSSARMTPSSMTRLVLAISKTMAATKLDPLRNSERASRHGGVRARRAGDAQPGGLGEGGGPIVSEHPRDGLAAYDGLDDRRQGEPEDQRPCDLPGHRPGHLQGVAQGGRGRTCPASLRDGPDGPTSGPWISRQSRVTPDRGVSGSPWVCDAGHTDVRPDEGPRCPRVSSRGRSRVVPRDGCRAGGITRGGVVHQPSSSRAQRHLGWGAGLDPQLDRLRHRRAVLRVACPATGSAEPRARGLRRCRVRGRPLGRPRLSSRRVGRGRSAGTSAHGRRGVPASSSCAEPRSDACDRDGAGGVRGPGDVRHGASL